MADSGLGREYWQEEVLSVIKGRGLQDFATYATLSRTGRRTPLSAEQRRRVWDLYVAYEQLLVARGVQDFEDVIAMALQVARRGGVRTYRYVFVDEAQDLSLLAVQLVAALVSDDKDGLTLVGDGQQAIYPGGYTLKEAGIAVTGRSTVLSINYRNTRQVLERAQQLVGGDDFDDLEDLAESGQRGIEVLRDGAAVREVLVADEVSADRAVVQQVQHDLAAGLPPGEAAVLCRTKRGAAQVRGLLADANVAAIDLVDYDGRPCDAVKVGTVKRAKGLEFGRVYLPGVQEYEVGGEGVDVERQQRERRELFVAMTRARDGLWLSTLR